MDKAKFDRLIEQFCSDDDGEYENAYLALVDNVDAYNDEILARMLAEEDPVLRGKFLEILGNTKNADLIPIFAQELKSPHDEVRMWAFFQLNRIDDDQARELLQDYISANPDDDWVQLFF